MESPNRSIGTKHATVYDINHWVMDYSMQKVMKSFQEGYWGLEDESLSTS